VSRLKLARKWTSLILAIAFFGIAIGFGVWLNKPYPRVSSTNDYTQTSPKGPQKVGTVLSWSKPKVCVPHGFTTSEIKATGPIVRNGKNQGTLSQTIAIREFRLTEGFCSEPNFTAVILPVNLTNGTYKITITACTQNPTPFPECIDPVEGPEFTIVGQPL
jgi:hypothetical protein